MTISWPHFLIRKPFAQALAWALAASIAACPLQGVTLAAGKAPSDAAMQQVERLVDQANALVAQEKFGEAIPLYEKAIGLLPAGTPNRAPMQRNLVVLYVNHAVGLSNHKQYDAALKLLDKALALEPGNTHATRNKAAVYFSRAMDLREANQNKPVEERNYEQVETLIKQALALDASDPNFKRALAANYLDNAIALAEAQRYDDAIELLEGARAAEPNNANINGSLANVYLSKAHEAEADAERNAWIDKALAVDNSSRTQTQAARIRQAAEARNTALSASPAVGPAAPGRTPMRAPAGKAGIQDMLLDVENQWGIERDPDAKLADRVANAEKQINGQVGEGPLAKRVQALYAQLYGATESAVEPGAAPMDLSEDALKNTYIAEVFKMTDGKVVRWGKFPLRVHITAPSDKENAEKLDGLFQADYKQSVLDALDLWAEASGGSMSYIEVKNPNAADVVFYWDKPYVDRFADPDKVPDRYKTYSAPKINNAVFQALNIAAMLSPGFFSLVPMLVGSGIQYKQLKKYDLIKKESEITLGLAPLRNLPPEEARNLIENMALKEYAHALGLKALSPTPEDVTYPELRSDSVKKPSPRDMATLQQLYGRPANVILNVN